MNIAVVSVSSPYSQMGDGLHQADVYLNSKVTVELHCLLWAAGMYRGAAFPFELQRKWDTPLLLHAWIPYDIIF